MKIKYSFEAHLWILLIVGITLIILSATGVIATQTIFDNVNITKNLTVMGLNVASCDVKTYTNGTLYCGTDATGAGGGGANVSTTTCSGTQKVSAVNNATGVVTCSADTDTDTFNTTAEMRTAINNTPGTFNMTVNNSVYFNGYATSYFQNGTELFNTSAQIWAVIDNSTFHKFSQTITWGNLSSWSLNNAWTGSLGGGNITSGTISTTQITDGTIATADLASGFAINFGNISAGWDLNKAWTNTLGWGNVSGRSLGIAWTGSLGAGNITSGTITATQLASTFAINLGNITDVANCTVAQKVIGKVAGAWVCGTDLFNTTEEMQDAAGALLGGTETLITVTYDDANGDIDFVVNNDLHSYSWTNVVDADITNTLTASNLVAGANVDIGAWELRASTFQSDVAAGTAPFIVASATQVANLNVSYAGTAYDLTCTDCIGGTEITVLTDADVNDAITIAGAVWVNSTTGMNTTKIYAPLICGDQACLHNMTYNGTQWTIYG